jgi:pseudaminic acid synthase
MTAHMVIDGRRIGPGEPVFVVAEISANHHQRMEEAIELIRVAAATGADAVKIQTYTPDTMTLRSDDELFRVGGNTVWDGRTLFDLYADAFTPWEWHPVLAQAAREAGLPLFSTPFDDTAVSFLEEMGVPAYKIASFELVDLPLLRRVAATGKPVILSTGMASKSEIAEAVANLRVAGCQELALLKCTSAYPAEPSEMNLATIPDLGATFDVPVGLSDHTLGAIVPVAAVALGACIVEKHLTLSRAAPGPDSAFSLEPEEFATMVSAIRTARQAVGGMVYGPTDRERASLAFRRSLFVVMELRQGEQFTRKNVRAIRPGYGLHTRHLDEILGRRASRDIPAGTPLAWDLVTGPVPKRTENHGASVP